MPDIKISSLTAVTSLVAAAEFPANDGGTSRKVTALQIREFMEAPLGTGMFLEEVFAALSANYTLNNTTTAQKLLNASTNGAVQVDADSTYFFETQFMVQSMSGTSGNLGFTILGAGTANINAASWAAVGLDNNTQATGAAAGGAFVNSATSTANIITAGTGTAAHAFIRGLLRVNSAGTIIPSINLTTAVATARVEAGAWFRMRKIGNKSVTTVGSWS